MFGNQKCDALDDDNDAADDDDDVDGATGIMIFMCHPCFTGDTKRAGLLVRLYVIFPCALSLIVMVPWSDVALDYINFSPLPSSLLLHYISVISPLPV